MKWHCLFCDYSTHSFQGLKQHIVRAHVFKECPVCGKSSRYLVSHFERNADTCWAHRLLWGLFCNGRSWRAMDRERKRAAVDFAEFMLRVRV